MAPGPPSPTSDAAAKPVASDVSETGSRDLDDFFKSPKRFFFLFFLGGGGRNHKKHPESLRTWNFKNCHGFPKESPFF